MFCRIIRFIFSFCQDFDIKVPFLVRSHIHACDSCKEFCRQRDMIAKTLTSAEEIEICSDSLHLEIMENIRRLPKPEQIQSSKHSLKYLYAFGSFAAILIIVAAVFIFSKQEKNLNQTTIPEIVEYQNILQPEQQIKGYFNAQVVNPMNSELESLKSDLIQTGEFFLAKLNVSRSSDTNREKSADL